MPAIRSRAVAALLPACLLLAACGTPTGASPPPPPSSAAPDPTATVPAGLRGSAIPPLDEQGPVIDLVDNRARLQQWRAGSLIVPVASMGLWKHVAEYSHSWGPVTLLDGRPLRRLGGRSAALRFSWPQAPPGRPAGSPVERVVIRLRGPAGQRLSLNLNGRNLRSAQLSGGFQLLEAAVPAGLSRRGENKLLLSAGNPGLLVHSLEIAGTPGPTVPEVPEAPEPPLDPLAPGEPRSFDGASTLVLPVEVPAGAFLRLGTSAAGGEARFRIGARPIGLAEQVLLDVVQPAGAVEERAVDLGPLAGTLVTLTFEVGAPPAAKTRWTAPRILLGHAETRPRPAPVDNVVLMVVDALRADRLALDGKTRVQTPRITAAGQAGAGVFRRAVAPSPSSPPSHAAIQSGQMPRLHGVGGDTARPAPMFSPVSSILARAGVATAFHGNNPFAMERLQAASAWSEFHQPNREGHGLDCTAVVKGALGFATRQAAAGKRFFLSTLPFEPHSPYRYHKGVTEHYFAGPFDPALGQTIEGEIVDRIAFGKLPMTPARWEQMRGNYDGEVEHFDTCFGQLVDGLDRIGVGPRTALLLTGDHGEGFGEHHHVGHAYGHWFEVIDVPLVVFAPGLGGAHTLDVPASGTDIAPTILDLMGMPPDPRMQGTSLLPMILRQGQWTTRVVASEYGRSYALHSPRYRYIVDYDGTELLYDHQSDPAEQAPLKDPDVLGHFRDLAGMHLALRSQLRGTWGSIDNLSATAVIDGNPGPLGNR